MMRFKLLLGLAVIWSCAGGDSGEGTPSTSVFEGARLIIGDGRVIEDAVFVVEDEIFAWVGSRSEAGEMLSGESVDLSGSTVMPALVNAHFHLSSDRAERISQLQHMLYYGTAATISLGLDEGEVGLRMREEELADAARSQSAGRGITSPEPGRTEVPYWITSEDEARAAVTELVAQNVDVVKIWVDSRGGSYDRLTPELYGAVIDEAHKNDLRVTAHVYSLEDAKGLLRAGIDIFAHGIRDTDVDEELIQLWTDRPHVILVPNLPGPGFPSDLSWLSGTIGAAELEEMGENQVERPAAQEAFGIQARNLLRLHEAGVAIAFGTDGSSPWAAHLELEDMVRTGMSPADVIISATANSATLLEMEDIGTVDVGKKANFIVLDANPLDDITNTRRISAVYLDGEAVDREAVGFQLLGG
ncbi:MAG: amidohydrolase family protein [bacterium]